MGSKIGAVIDPKGEILARLKHDIENKRLDRYNISGSIISNIQSSFKQQETGYIFSISGYFWHKLKHKLSKYQALVMESHQINKKLLRIVWFKSWKTNSSKPRSRPMKELL